MAQSLWPDSLRGRAELGLEWSRPTFATNDDAYSGTRGIWILGARARVSDRLNAVVAIPRFVATEGSDGHTIGNPYVGIEFLKEDHRPELSLGIRLDMVDNAYSPAHDVGYYGDFDRFEAMMPRTVAIVATGYHEPFHGDDGGYARIRVGATILRAVGSGVNGGAEMYVNYGVRIGRDRPALRLSAELTGRWSLSAGGRASFAESTIHQGAATASFLSGQLRPYVGVRMPIDEDLTPALRHVFVFGVTTYLD